MTAAESMAAGADGGTVETMDDTSWPDRATAEARLAELRAQAAERVAACGEPRPDTPEEIAEQAAVTAALMPYQLAAIAAADAASD